MNRRFTDEMLALIFLSRMRRLRRERKATAEAADDSTAGRPPRRVSNREFFSAKLTPTLANPNAHCFKRVQVM